MDDAIGSQISDYLIKPVNPNQVLLSLKKIIDNKRLVAEKTTSAYQQQFRHLFTALNSDPDHKEWRDIYKKLVYWELEMQRTDSPEMEEVLQSQKTEANTEFFKFISRHYASWIQVASDTTPTMSHTLLKRKVFPLLKKGTPVFFVLIDNLRFDQWKAIEPVLSASFRLEELLRAQLKEAGLGDLRFSYTKVVNNQSGQELQQQIHNLMGNDLNVIVYNFVDMLSHARTEMEVLKELAGDEKSYRSVTRSWFEHSPLHQALRRVADKPLTLVIATDHGSVRVKTPARVIGDKQTTTNLRYKHGRNLQYEPRDVLAFREPRQAGLPSPAINSSYIFAKGDLFLCYPNNYNHYANYYRNTFQHGGVSLEEMIVPIITLQSR